MKLSTHRVFPLACVAVLTMQNVRASAACDEDRLARAVETEALRPGKNATQQQKMASVNLGLALAHLGRTERALQIVQKSVNLQGDDSFGREENARWRDEVLRIAARRTGL